MFCIYILVVYVALVALRPTRRVALALMPWVIFACSYDAMRLYPNYMVNDIDVRQPCPLARRLSLAPGLPSTIMPWPMSWLDSSICAGCQCPWPLRCVSISVVDIRSISASPLPSLWSI